MAHDLHLSVRLHVYLHVMEVHTTQVLVAQLIYRVLSSRIFLRAHLTPLKRPRFRSLATICVKRRMLRVLPV